MEKCDSITIHIFYLYFKYLQNWNSSKSLSMLIKGMEDNKDKYSKGDIEYLLMESKMFYDETIISTNDDVKTFDDVLQLIVDYLRVKKIDDILNVTNY